MSEEGLCAVCRTPSGLKCGECRQVVYCSKDHQRSHWKIHKQECWGSNFKVVKDKSGNHLVALKFIPEGKIVLQEKPLVAVPRITVLACFGCNSEFNCQRFCSSCGFPVCSLACEKSDTHKPECEMTVKYRKSKFVLEGCVPTFLKYAVMFFRCLYLRTRNKSAWSKICMLRKGKRNLRKDIVDCVSYLLENEFHYKDFKREDLSQIIEIYEVNHVPDLLFDGIYNKASFIEHNCSPNCALDVAGDNTVFVRALRNINEGESLSVTYMRIGRECINKPEVLKSRNLICKCHHCTSPDPEDHSESIKCPRLQCPGYVFPRLIPETSAYTWKCTLCHHILPEKSLRHFKRLISGVDVIEDDPEDHEVLLSILQRLLHPDHSMILFLKVVRFKKQFVTSFSNEKELKKLYEMWYDLHNAPSRFLQHKILLRLELFACQNLILEELSGRKHLTFDEIIMIRHLLKNINNTAAALLKLEPVCVEEVMLLGIVKSYMFPAMGFMPLPPPFTELSFFCDDD